MTERANLWQIFKRNKTAVVGMWIASAVILVAVFAPFISPLDPLEKNLIRRMKPPGEMNLLGTDPYGRDTLSRVIYGSRVSLLVGLTSVLVGMILGSISGVLAGLKGGKIETAIMRGTDVLMSFPTLIMGMMVMILLGHGLFNLISAIGIVLIPRFARVAHAATLSVKERDYIVAARAIGIGDVKLIIRHIIPNIFGDILVVGTLWMATAIRIEASLSFLGLGVSPPIATWGNMIRDGVQHLDSPWLAVIPGLAILITALSFNMLGDGLRDISDPKLR